MIKATKIFVLSCVLLSVASCKKLCIYCNCNYNTLVNHEESDCVAGFQNETTKLSDYEKKLKEENGYSYCDCYGVNK